MHTESIYRHLNFTFVFMYFRRIVASKRTVKVAEMTLSTLVHVLMPLFVEIWIETCPQEKDFREKNEAGKILYPVFIITHLPIYQYKSHNIYHAFWQYVFTTINYSAF